MIRHVLGKHHEGHGDIRHGNGADIGPAQLVKGTKSGEEGEIGQRNEGIEGDTALYQLGEVGEIHNHQGVVVGGDTDDGEQSRQHVACQNTEDKGNQTHHFLTEGGGQHGHRQGDEAANQRNIGRTAGRGQGFAAVSVDGDHDFGVHLLRRDGLIQFHVLIHHDILGAVGVVDTEEIGAVFGLLHGGGVDLHDLIIVGVIIAVDLAHLQVAHGVTCQRQADDRHRRADDHRRHQLIQPVDTCQLDGGGDGHVHQTGQHRTDDEAHIAQCHRGSAGEGRQHRADECEGRAEEYRALALGEQDVHQRTHACTHQRGGGAHTVADDDRHHQRGGHNGQQLLDGKDDEFAEFRLVLHVVNQFHNLPPIFGAYRTQCHRLL